MSAANPTTRLNELAHQVRRRVQRQAAPAVTADLVADALGPFMSAPDLLTEQQRTGAEQHYVQHLLHAEPDGSFSIVALVWLPGQQTAVHDHVAWCVAGVYEGTEHEQRFEVRGEGADRYLVPTESLTNAQGETIGFAPPGDIHLVRNCGRGKAISLHVYGADVGALGSSVRRTYDLPIG